MPCQTYVLMKKKRQPLTLCGKKVVEDSTEEESDPVWREYRGNESVEYDDVLREVVKKSEWRGCESGIDERLFGYIASEKESCVEQEENRKEEESTTKFDALEMNDSEFTL